jgi:hypothetical protein
VRAGTMTSQQMCANLLDATAIVLMLLGAISTIVCGVWTFVATERMLPLNCLTLSVLVFMGGMKILNYSFTKYPK